MFDVRAGKVRTADPPTKSLVKPSGSVIDCDSLNTSQQL